ncbi:hypothetical protein GZ77_15415 [Endozoicomonas montiporae]|uniref:DUF305 domain-containing protein n=2 Tax=Endozoicomonas montiporae TaxID=1027273 RepID=A0A081N5G6_9GAMM|nr:hypothetical protein [Endozoicomonas montiporae]AMO57424.1 hypothetical protein EZMO1_3434 [Endozoicomonas montiporae CL-33]KEQ13689.1 hypothetical protein GZ77_15415 [Endozoicomonas montiporae]
MASHHGGMVTALLALANNDMDAAANAYEGNEFTEQLQNAILADIQSVGQASENLILFLFLLRRSLPVSNPDCTN